MVIDSLRGTLHHISSSFSNDFSIVYASTSLDPMVVVDTFPMRSAFKRSDRNETAPWKSHRSMRTTQGSVHNNMLTLAPPPRGMPSRWTDCTSD